MVGALGQGFEQGQVAVVLAGEVDEPVHVRETLAQLRGDALEHPLAAARLTCFGGGTENTQTKRAFPSCLVLALPEETSYYDIKVSKSLDERFPTA